MTRGDIQALKIEPTKWCHVIIFISPMRNPNFSSNPSRHHAGSFRRSPSTRWSSRPPQLQRTTTLQQRLYLLPHTFTIPVALQQCAPAPPCRPPLTHTTTAFLHPFSHGNHSPRRSFYSNGEQSPRICT